MRHLRKNVGRSPLKCDTIHETTFWFSPEKSYYSSWKDSVPCFNSYKHIYLGYLLCLLDSWHSAVVHVWYFLPRDFPYTSFFLLFHGTADRRILQSKIFAHWVVFLFKLKACIMYLIYFFNFWYTYQDIFDLILCVTVIKQNASSHICIWHWELSYYQMPNFNNSCYF